VDNIIKQAVIMWTGYHLKSLPSRDDDVIINNYGYIKGKELLQMIKGLESEFYQSKAYQSAGDLKLLYEISKNDFIKNHPNIDPEISEAFAWCYSFDYK